MVIFKLIKKYINLVLFLFHGSTSGKTSKLGRIWLKASYFKQDINGLGQSSCELG